MQKKSSNINTVFSSPEISSELLDLSKRIIRYYEETNSGLIYFSNTKKSSIDAFVIGKNNYHYNKENNKYIRKHMKAAYNLGIVMAKDKPHDVILKLGLK